MSQPQTESYTAAKGGIASLTHALAICLAGNLFLFLAPLICWIYMTVFLKLTEEKWLAE